MSVVVPILTARAAKAKGVALAVACAANRLGLSPQQVIVCARAAADQVRAGKTSPAKVYSDTTAQLRAEQKELA